MVNMVLTSLITTDQLSEQTNVIVNSSCNIPGTSRGNAFSVDLQGMVDMKVKEIKWSRCTRGRGLVDDPLGEDSLLRSLCIDNSNIIFFYIIFFIFFIL